MAPMIARGPAGCIRLMAGGPAAKAAGPPAESADRAAGQLGMCSAVQPRLVSISGLALIVEIVVPP